MAKRQRAEKLQTREGVKLADEKAATFQDRYGKFADLEDADMSDLLPTIRQVGQRKTSRSDSIEYGADIDMGGAFEYDDERREEAEESFKDFKRDRKAELKKVKDSDKTAEEKKEEVSRLFQEYLVEVKGERRVGFKGLNAQKKLRDDERAEFKEEREVIVDDAVLDSSKLAYEARKKAGYAWTTTTDKSTVQVEAMYKHAKEELAAYHEAQEALAELENEFYELRRKGEEHTEVGPPGANGAATTIVVEGKELTRKEDVRLRNLPDLIEEAEKERDEAKKAYILALPDSIKKAKKETAAGIKSSKPSDDKKTDDEVPAPVSLAAADASSAKVSFFTTYKWPLVGTTVVVVLGCAGAGYYFFGRSRSGKGSSV